MAPLFQMCGADQSFFFCIFVRICRFFVGFFVGFICFICHFCLTIFQVLLPMILTEAWFWAALWTHKRILCFWQLSTSGPSNVPFLYILSLCFPLLISFFGFPFVLRVYVASPPHLLEFIFILHVPHFVFHISYSTFHISHFIFQH